MGTHWRVLNEIYPMNTNMTGFRWFSKYLLHVLWMKDALALEGSGNFLVFKTFADFSEHVYAIRYEKVDDKFLRSGNALTFHQLGQSRLTLMEALSFFV